MINDKCVIRRWIVLKMEDDFKKEYTDKYKYRKWDFRNDVASSIENVVLLDFYYDLKVIYSILTKWYD